MSGLATRLLPVAGTSLVVALLLANTVVGVSLAYTRHEARRLFNELQTLSRERDELNIRWGQLQLEQAAVAGHSQIEMKAGKTLSLVRPASSDIYLIGADGDYRFVGLETLSEEFARLAEQPQERTE
ncbi:MAG: cell division protein FtsL [Pseudomonadota bacterium]